MAQFPGTLVFVIVLYMTHAIYGIWAYPILSILSDLQRIILLAGLFIISISFYFVGEFFNNLRWQHRLETAKKNKVK
jgi:hypothetical protein